jgi:hypothetical protein
MNDAASRARASNIPMTPRETRQFNTLVAAAASYNLVYGPPEEET